MIISVTVRTIARFLLVLGPLFACTTSFAGWDLVQNSPTTNDLHSIFFLNDSTGWIAGDNSTMFKTIDGGGSWIQQTSPEATDFQCVMFVSATTGWACGTGGTVIKTADGGETWQSQTFTGVKFNSVHFADLQHGFIAGDNGIIWHSSDGGGNWVNQASGMSQNLHQIRAIGSTFGLAVGDNDYILRTSNGGNSWEVMSGPSLGNQTLYSFDSFFGFSQSVMATGTLTRSSTDNGASWSLGGFPTEAIRAVVCLDNGETYCGVGSHGYIARTVDNGMTWSPEESPTSQDLYSIHRKSNSYASLMWAVGAHGTILKRTANWERVWANVSTFQDVDFLDHATGFAIAMGGGIYKTTSGGKSWQQVWGGSASLVALSFVDLNTGYVVGTEFEITILKTTDGGASWDTLFAPTLFAPLDVYFTSPDTGYIVGTLGNILRTADGGLTWDAPLSGASAVLRAVRFTNAETGYVVGSSGVILKTTDSGSSWISQYSNIFYDLHSVYFVDANKGYAVGDRPNYSPRGVIVKTTNGGAFWNAEHTEGPLLALHFVDTSLGYMCSPDSIYKTTNGGTDWFTDDVPPGASGNMSSLDFVLDGGRVAGFAAGADLLRTSYDYFAGDPPGHGGDYPGWVQVHSATTGTLRGVEYLTPSVAFAVGDPPFDFLATEKGMILKTINGGQTWTRQQSNDTSLYLNDVSFADENNGMAVGGKGVIVRTSNSGATWAQQPSGTTNMLEAVDMLDANNAFACGGCNIIGCGNTNTLLHTSDGGANWQIQTNGTSGYWWDIDIIDPATATAVGIQGKIIRTTNAGLSWFPQSGGGSLHLTGVQFLDVNHGIAISSEGPVLRTTDAGTNWVQTDSLGGSPESISYVDSTSAFVVTLSGGVAGLMYRSTDGGVSWTLADSINAPLLASSFADANNGLVVGVGGIILRTSNGGIVSGNTTEYARNGLGLPIDDFQNSVDSIIVNGPGRSDAHALFNGSVVTRVYLTIDTLLHPSDGDLEVYLEHNGTIDTLMYHSGGGGANFVGTFFNDAAAFPLLSGTAPFQGSFRPYRPLSRFFGHTPDGTWRLRVYDGVSGNTGSLEAWSLSLATQVLTGISEDTEMPSQYQLSQNYPNPFNPSTTIRYGLPSSSIVTLRIFNILGQAVATLIDGEMAAGEHQAVWDASRHSSGVYFYRLQAGSFTETKKLLLIR